MTHAAKDSALASKIMQLRQLQTRMAMQQQYMKAGTIKNLVGTDLERKHVSTWLLPTCRLLYIYIYYVLLSLILNG